MVEDMISEKDLISMKLLHYFITKKNYNPIIVQGVENEIWLENLDEDYKVVRIVSNYIHNNEQLGFDRFRSKQIVKKLRMKTFSWKMNVFNIYVANCDAIANNVAIWKTKYKGNGEYEDSKWRYMLYDTDDSAGMVTDLSSVDTDSFISGHWSQNPIGDNGNPVFIALLQNEEFKQLFVTSFLDMANYNFEYSSVSQKLKVLADYYEPGVIASNNRFRGEVYIDGYNDARNGWR